MSSDLGLVLDRHVDHAPVPAQVVHPLQARDPMHRLPGVESELRLEPGAEGEIGEAERGSGQFRRRAQRLHARVGRPRAFEACGRTVEQPHVPDAQSLQRERRRQPAHAGADDGDIEQRAPAGCTRGLEPVLGGRNDQQLKIARKPRLELGQRCAGRGRRRQNQACITAPRLVLLRRDRRRGCADRAADRAPARTARCGRSAGHSRSRRSAARDARSARP